MAFENLKIRAMDGSVLVEGRLTLHGPEAFAAVLPSAGPKDLIGVTLTHKKLHRSSINLYSNTRRADDGLYAAASPVVSIEFGNPMPNLHRLASSMFGEATQKMLISGTAVNSMWKYALTVSLKPRGDGNALPVYAHLKKYRWKLSGAKRGLLSGLRGLSCLSRSKRTVPFLKT